MHLKIEKMYDSQCIIPCVYMIMLISNLEISRPWSSPKPACEFLSFGLPDSIHTLGQRQLKETRFVGPTFGDH